MLIVSKAIMMSALAREESRGSHFRSDFPDTREEYCRCSVAEYTDGEIKTGFENDRARGDK